ncbi:sodium:solute symporter family protein [Sporomusa sp.]|uniref:sodium:solute symporter family protein n=2 Tax=Sporomusa sp. TaxID=2078658 RepID=UPI002B95927C|nr:sodium:solute symporter family protein [Sporomusa sp.]HWR45512.1 sodium:solute symporter family protein [Sporomusa sp.]
MKLGILIAVLAFEFLCIIAVGWYLNRQQNKQDGFLLAGRSLNWQLLSITLALSILGTPHIYGMFEMAWFMGAASLWFGFGCSILLVVVCVFTGRWVRRLNVSSMPELMHMLFGEKMRLILPSVMIPIIWAVMTLELQGMGISFALMTGVTVEQGVYLGAVLGVLYVCLSGLNQVVWLNIINAIIKYVGLAVATILLTNRLPHGWAGVSQYFIDQGQPWMLSIWGTPQILISFGMSTVIAILVNHSLGQQLMQPCMAAKNDRVVANSMWMAVIVNGMLAVFTISMGLAAKSIPEFHALGPKMAAISMLLEYLPNFAIALVLAAFFGSMLSGFSIIALVTSTLFTKDIYAYTSNKCMSPTEENRVARITIIVFCILATVVAPILPPIVTAINWLFSWPAPIMVMCLIGLFWKRSTTAAITTMVAAWIVNMLWSFTSLPAAIGLEMLTTANVYATLSVSIVVGALMTALCEGKPGIFRVSEAVLTQEKAEAAQA